jgi:hypothetical protein
MLRSLTAFVVDLYFLAHMTIFARGAFSFCAGIDPWLSASACTLRADLNTSPSIRR